MTNNKTLQTKQNVFLGQTHRKTSTTQIEKQEELKVKNSHGVWQDKGVPGRARTASGRPAPQTKVARPVSLHNTVVRSQSANIRGQKATKVTLWVKPRIKAELSRLAEQEGLSLSATGARLLEDALVKNLHVQNAVLLQPIIEQAIKRQMGTLSTRLAWLLVRVGFDAGQTRSLVTNVLGRQPGVSPDVLKTILSESGKTAKGNLSRRTPQLVELVESVERWMVEENGEGKLKR